MAPAHPPRRNDKTKPQVGFNLTLDPQVVATYTRQRIKLRANPNDPAWRNRRVQKQQALNDEAAYRLAANEVLLTEQEGFLETEDSRPTFQVNQKELVDELDLESKSKVLNLKLSFGPYEVDYTANGKYLLIAGAKGSLAVLNCATWAAQAETNVRETVRSVKFLNDDQRFAAAQRKYIHIYDENATEVHVLRDQLRVTGLAYLPFHWLLVGAAEVGTLSWTDVSDGRLVRMTKQKILRESTIAVDAATAVVAAGNSRGNVTLWTPNDEAPAVGWHAHRGPINSMVFLDRSPYIATAGGDLLMRVWDIRRLDSCIYGVRHRYGASPDLAVSGNGLLAASSGGIVEIWKEPTVKAPAPYLYFKAPSEPESFAFRPYEDFLTVGHEDGISTMVVPGSAIANFDIYAANPYESRKGKSERTIKSLLDKLPPETITVDYLNDEPPR